jgi:MFS family permease
VLRQIFPSVSFNLDFEKLWWAQILASLAFNTLTYSLIIRIADRTGSNTPVSLFILSFSIPALLFGLLAGVWVDRLDRRMVLIFTNLSRALLIPAFYFGEQYNFVLVYPLAIIMSMITQFFIPAEATKLASLVTHKMLHQANSLFTFTLYATFIAGPIAAGPSLRFLGLGRVSIVLFALFSLATLLCVLLPRDNGGAPKKNGGSLKVELWDAFRHISSKAQVWSGLALLTFSQALISTVIAIAPGYARSVVGIAVTDTSLLLLGPAAAGMIAGAALLSRFGHRLTGVRSVIIGMFGAGVGIMLLGFINLFEPVADPVILAATLLFLLGIANAMVIVPAQTAIQINTPEELRGRVFGVLGTLVNAASFLPVLFAGVIADTLGVASVVVLLGLVVLLTSYYCWERGLQGRLV